MISVVLALHMTVYNIVFVTSTMSIELHISYMKLDITIIVRILKKKTSIYLALVVVKPSISPPPPKKEDKIAMKLAR